MVPFGFDTTRRHGFVESTVPSSNRHRPGFGRRATAGRLAGFHAARIFFPLGRADDAAGENASARPRTLANPVVPGARIAESVGAPSREALQLKELLPWHTLCLPLAFADACCSSHS